MPIEKPRPLVRLEMEKAAEAYLRSLPPEHFMEGFDQAAQREITLESLRVMKLYLSNLYYFNEMLIQYRLPRRRKLGQFVPDNMVVLWDAKIKAKGSYDLPLQPVGPYWVLEYISKHSERKDYDQSFAKYERELKVPYCLMFYPDEQELTLYRHTGRKYVTVRPNEHGRYAIPDLELELGILEEWMRFWFQGKLIALPDELQRSLDESQRQAAESALQAEEEKQARLAAEQELAQVKAELEELRRRRRNGT